MTEGLKITELPVLNMSSLSKDDVLPIVDVSLDSTNQISIDTLSQYVSKSVVVTSTWNDITNKPNTIAGYGILDAYTATQVDQLLQAYSPVMSYAGPTNDGLLYSSDWNKFNSKQDTIPLGTTAQYYRGDKTWATMPTVPTLVSQLTNDSGFVTSTSVSNSLSNYLAKNNSIAYTPTAQYHPATKGYVDAIAGAGGGNVAITEIFRYIGDGTTTNFAATYIVGSLSVSINGLIIDTTRYTAINGTSITISPAPAINDIINIIAYGGADVYTKAQVDSYLANKQNTIPLGTTAQYYRGDKTWATMPTVPTLVSQLTNDSGFVTSTYHDNTKQDTLVSGTNIKTINSTSLLSSGDLALVPGTWNSVDATYDITLGSYVHKLGENIVFYAKASETITIGQTVMFSGSEGDHIIISKATNATLQTNPQYFVGVAAQNFNTNDLGYIIWHGKLSNIDTTTYTQGSILYFNPSISGGLTTTTPIAPNAKILVAACLRNHATQGVLLIRPSVGYKLDQLHNMNISSVANNDIIKYDTASSTWKNSSLTGSTWTFTAPQRGTITTANTLAYDLSLTNNFISTPISSGSLTFSNLVSGQSGNILFINGSNYIIAKNTNTKCTSTALTTLSTTGTYWISYICDGSFVYLSVSSALS